MKYILIFLSISGSGPLYISGSTNDPLYSGGYPTLAICEQDVPVKKAAMGGSFPSGLPVCLAIDPALSQSLIPQESGQWVTP